jgi:transcriptional regulator with XRE-family HTH domain
MAANEGPAQTAEGRVARQGNGSAPEYGAIGGHLREVRVARGLSLRALAERVGVSPSLISQVETGRARPSVRTLYAIASELRISLDELLFPDAAQAPIGPIEAEGSAAADVPATWPELRLPEQPVQRSGDRKVIRLASGVVWERLTTASIPNVDFLHVTYEVGGESSPADAFQRHTGQEWGYVLSGTLTVRIGFDEFLLRPGDAISFDSTTPHRLFNAGDTPARAVWFVLGRGSPNVARH